MQANSKATNPTFSRRHFMAACTGAPFFAKILLDEPFTNSVKGKINVSDLGMTLIHEHVLVDFIGADKITPDRWRHEDVIKKVLPYLLGIKKRGIQSLLECTPAYLGRDVLLLQKLADKSGLNILTNTGYYGASDNKYLPAFALTETAEQLARRWINEFEHGIDGTKIKPGFIKTGVNSGPLSAIHRKLIEAAAITHLKSGLTICSHTGPALPAEQEIEILKKAGVSPAAFVWVHANGSNNDFEKIGQSGCWISLDGVNEDNVGKIAALIIFLKSEGFLKQILLSHDAGWYRPGEPEGGDFRGYTAIPDKLLPLLESKGLSDSEITQMIVTNPAKAFAVQVRRV